MRVFFFSVSPSFLLPPCCPCSGRIHQNGALLLNPIKITRRGNLTPQRPSYGALREKFTHLVPQPSRNGRKGSSIQHNLKLKEDWWKNLLVFL